MEVKEMTIQEALDEIKLMAQEFISGPIEVQEQHPRRFMALTTAMGALSAFDNMLTYMGRPDARKTDT